MIKTKFILLIALFSINLIAQQPTINHIYTADPSAHVWPNDPNTLWVYSSHDVPNTNHHITMFDYHVFSTQDMINWTDLGRVLSVDNVDWEISHAWAIDAAFWKDKYYLVYCMRPIDDSKKFKIGIAVSDFPEGPWLHKYNEKYYLSYPGLRDDKWPEVMYYSMADSPMGPYKSMGQYIPWFEKQAGTNHGSIAKFKGKWFASNKKSYSKFSLGIANLKQGDDNIRFMTVNGDIKLDHFILTPV